MIYLISLLIFGLDFATKWLATTHLPFAIAVPVCPFFNFYLISNRGISFSLLSAKSESGVWLLILIACAICGLLIYTICHERDKVSRVALAMVLGGAIGNIYDRLQYGAVVDFLDFYYENHHFPAFNIADSFICIGMFIILYKMVVTKEKKCVL